MTKSSTEIPSWKRPDVSLHAHFDCFSGAAGDMMLAACLDAAGEEESLLEYVSYCLSKGMPELDGEFEIIQKRVWRGIGSIAATSVEVTSKYQHEAAPVPEKESKEGSHSHDHSHERVSDHHSHQHHHSSESSHSHTHSHTHSGVSSEVSEQASRQLQQQNEHRHNHDHPHTHTHDHEHSHSHQESSTTTTTIGPLRNLPQIREMLEAASSEYIPDWVKDKAIEAFKCLAKAEAATHGAASEDAVHFHEVGAVDSIVDTVGTLIALHALGVETVSCTRLPLGEGTVWTAHGLLPVPAPATLRLMVGMPTCSGPPGVTGELVTPTAAALLKVLVQTFTAKIPGRPPAFTIQKVGVGAGTKDFVKHPNVLRLVLGDNVVVDGVKESNI